MALRLVRLTRLLLKEPKLESIAHEVYRFAPMLLELFLTMFVVALFFVFIGSLLFHQIEFDSLNTLA